LREAIHSFAVAFFDVFAHIKVLDFAAKPNRVRSGIE